MKQSDHHKSYKATKFPHFNKNKQQIWRSSFKRLINRGIYPRIQNK